MAFHSNWFWFSVHSQKFGKYLYKEQFLFKFQFAQIRYSNFNVVAFKETDFPSNHCRLIEKNISNCLQEMLQLLVFLCMLLYLCNNWFWYEYYVGRPAWKLTYLLLVRFITVFAKRYQVCLTRCFLTAKHNATFNNI